MSVSISLYELTKKHDLDAYVDQCVEADDVMTKGFQATIDKLTVDLQKNLPAELKPVRVVKVKYSNNWAQNYNACFLKAKKTIS